MAEYKKLDSEQILYTQKSMLQAQLEALTSVKQIRNYKALRHEELLEKIKFKKVLDEVRQELDVLMRSLPEPSYEQEEEVIASPLQAGEKAKGHSLEDELDAIKAKLASLQ
jgi:hypothetical protein